MSEKELIDKLVEIKESNLKEVGIEKEIATLQKEIAVHFEKVQKLFEESDNTTTSTL